MSTAILLLAYGTPSTPDEVEPYFTHIRGGRAPSAEAVTRLKERYELIGGRTPLLDITRETAAALQAALDARAPSAYRTYIGMKHWHPFISEAVRQMDAAGVRRVIAIVLAPHYSRLSVEGYRTYLDEALENLAAPPEIHFVRNWHLQPEFIEMMSERLTEALAEFSPDMRDEVCVVFSAHSLPERIRSWGDPYESQLMDSCAAVAARAGLAGWRFAWQSAGQTGEPWLGPDIVDYLRTLHGEGVQAVLSVPIGFVCDHLEVLYDIDHEAAASAAALGMTLRRTRMPNASPRMIAALEAVIAEVERRSAAGMAAEA
ncbi:MAG TPA: ferrochelatase [Gemmatimonadaceae bacterium]|nr:ferrochelatase [Gemmatimonadaceae bacterium]